jgi:hypothetical protein
MYEFGQERRFKLLLSWTIDCHEYPIKITPSVQVLVARLDSVEELSAPVKLLYCPYREELTSIE